MYIYFNIVHKLSNHKTIIKQHNNLYQNLIKVNFMTERIKIEIMLTLLETNNNFDFKKAFPHAPVLPFLCGQVDLKKQPAIDKN